MCSTRLNDGDTRPKHRAPGMIVWIYDFRADRISTPFRPQKQGYQTEKLNLGKFFPAEHQVQNGDLPESRTSNVDLDGVPRLIFRTETLIDLSGNSTFRRSTRSLTHVVWNEEQGVFCTVYSVHSPWFRSNTSNMQVATVADQILRIFQTAKINVNVMHKLIQCR